MKFVNDWVLALRLARRFARRTLGKTLLIAAIVGLPVLLGSWFSVVQRGVNPTGEVYARTVMGSADAQLTAPSGRTDVRRALPAGSHVARAVMSTGSIELRGSGADLTANLYAGDLTDPINNGTYRMDEGRMPTKPDEVALSPSLADHLGLHVGGTLTTAAGTKYRIVGMARTITLSTSRDVFTTTALADPEAQAEYRLDLPNGTDLAALATKLKPQELFLTTRAELVDPDIPRGPVGADAARILMIGFGVLELVLLAGTAFAVIARRQTRELGLVTAAGGTAADVRRVVLAQGLFAGLVGAGVGLVVGVSVALVGKSWWESASATLITQWQIPWVRLVVVVTVGLVAGVAAALVPAIGAGRRPPMAALAGRFAGVTGSARLRLLAFVLVLAGVVLSVIGNIRLGAALDAARVARLASDPGEVSRVASASPTWPVTLVVAGITLVVAGLVWMLPALVGRVAGLVRGMPLGVRMAMRDASRHRHRTGPVTAAIMIAVAGTTALGFAIVNQSAAKEQNYRPVGLPGEAVLQFYLGDVRYSPELVDQVQSLLPVEHRYQQGLVTLYGTKETNGYVPTVSVSPTGDSLKAVDPAYVARFGDWGRKAAAALRQGQVVVPPTTPVRDGKVQLSRGDPSGRSTFAYPGAVVGAPPKISFLEHAALISADAAKRLGTADVDETHFILSRPPTDQQLAAVAKLLGHEDELKVERGYQSPVRNASIGLLALGATATLLGVAMSVSLSMSEGRADFATLAAVGAPPRLRRGLAAAQGWFLGQLGCVLGVAVGALYGFTAHTVVGSPHVVVPWAVIAGIAVAVPLFAALVPYVLTRSKLEMVRRVD
ncbi:FtsX-like permease family protein [Kribbella solani]|uniref:Putative ABC transport system permease protein n=1 Tax=Kribbella solani TaxID=236067 RepID=A0A841E9N7_9ACTN|nr:putative ABC transport system permease protein [Kribbella solani]